MSMEDRKLKKYSLSEHYNELKIRVLYSTFLFATIFIFCCYYGEFLVNFILYPLSLKVSDHKVILTNLPEGFISQKQK